MAARDSNRPVSGNKSWFVILLVIAAAGIWVFQQYNALSHGGKKPSDWEKSHPSATDSRDSRGARRESPSDVTPSRKSSLTGNYETYPNCVLVEARNNDGDSFMVRLPDGREKELRLYYVDTPESAFKRYAGGETNHERIRQQAAELGGITPEQAVEIGKQGKAFTLGLLAARPFTVFTVWDSPYQDNRYHAFIRVEQGGKPRWLHELLIERGLARIKTKPADLPDGTPVSTQRQRLQSLESGAKKARVGVWKL
ncbi:MAG: thermonuclease family protein [Verrucomicrobia bacterium]|nr:thermonuclease family protein [Verrucomicrobiota bacterium]